MIEVTEPWGAHTRSSKPAKSWLCAKCQERYRMTRSDYCVWCALVVDQ